MKTPRHPFLGCRGARSVAAADYVGRVCVGGCCGRCGLGLAPGFWGACGLGCAGEASRGRSPGLPVIGFLASLIANLHVVRDRLDALPNHPSTLPPAIDESRVIALLLSLQRESPPAPRQRAVKARCC